MTFGLIELERQDFVGHSLKHSSRTRLALDYVNSVTGKDKRPAYAQILAQRILIDAEVIEVTNNLPPDHALAIAAEDVLFDESSETYMPEDSPVVGEAVDLAMRAEAVAEAIVAMNLVSFESN